jgi:pimeloyl-ACP methyl ester carboxylesterase
MTTVEQWGHRGPIALAVHGMTSSRRSWARLAAHLNGRFRVVAYDQRGHGESAAVLGPMSLERGLSDARNVAASLDEPIELLIGHSWGGAVAVLAGTRLPVRRVAAIDPMIHQAGDAWYREFLDELAELFASTGDERDAKVREEYAAWAPVDVEGKVHAVHAMTPVPIERLWHENPAASWDLHPAIAAYEKPLLLAMAAAGESINDDAALEDIEAAHPPSVALVEFPGAGHNLQRTAFDTFAQCLDAWLKSTER